MNDSWIALRRFTRARIALGRAGHAVPTPVLLDFQLAHAQARDAVHFPWDVDAFAGQVRKLGEEALILNTPVAGRNEYLRRPDLGRILTEESRNRLRSATAGETDVALIVTNGLSSTAVDRHGIPLLQAIVNGYRARHLRIAPIALVANGRVALLDDIGSAVAARVAVIIVGERPGLSAADSLGIYLTFAPQPGNTDAERNCISNIRPPEGLSYEDAAEKLMYLTDEALRRGISGVALKDESAGLLSEGNGKAVVHEIHEKH
jgi:ethanolamine ammonia-lyase small subunit